MVFLWFSYGFPIKTSIFPWFFMTPGATLPAKDDLGGGWTAHGQRCLPRPAGGRRFWRFFLNQNGDFLREMVIYPYP